MSKQKTSLLAQGLPLLAFMGAGWFGVAQVVQNKRDLNVRES